MKQILLFIAITFTIYSKSYELKLNLTKGHTYYINSFSYLEIVQDEEKYDQTIQTFIKSIVSFKVKKELKSKYELEVMHKSIDIDLLLPRSNNYFSSENIDSSSRLFSKILSKVKNRPFKLTINKNGIIEGIYGIENLWTGIFNEFPDISDYKKEEIVKQLKKSFGENKFKSSIEIITALFPKKKVRVNEKWSNAIQLKSTMSSNVKNTFRLVSYDSGFAEIEVNSIINTDGQETIVDGKPTKYSLTGEMKSKVRIDPKSGWLIDSEFTQNMEGDVKVKDGGQKDTLNWISDSIKIEMKMRATGTFIQHDYTTIEDYDTLISICMKLSSNNMTNVVKPIVEKALKIDTTRVEAYYSLGYYYADDCYEDELNCDKAINYLNISIDKDKHFRHALYHRGLCYRNIGKTKEALSDLNDAIKNDSTEMYYFLDRAHVKFILKDTVGTCKDYNRAKELGFNDYIKWYKEVCK